MKNPFKNFTSSIVSVMEKPRSQNEIIAEIHESFYTEVDRLLAEAKISNSLETQKTDLIEKSKRLRSLGFSQTKEIVEADAEAKRIEALEKENEAKKNLVAAINYFSQKYPHYKFITEESVKTICKKYGLIYGDIANYKGDVPDKNLKHIEQFAVETNDHCFAIEETRMGWSGGVLTRITAYTTQGELERKETVRRERIEKDMETYGVSAMMEPSYYSNPYRSTVSNRKLPLEIAAPEKDFDTRRMEIVDHKLVPMVDKDPVVLYPVYFAGNKHYLIVTAWGIEASDPLVVNQKMN